MDTQTQDPIAMLAIEALGDIEQTPVARRSVVASSYKATYAERAAASRGRKTVSKKVEARSCGDWLALEIAERCVVGTTLSIPAFEAVLDANGVAHAHWNRTSRGWQGRLRMTGRLALQRVVAEADGELALPDGTTTKAPRNWVAKYTH